MLFGLINTLLFCSHKSKQIIPSKLLQNSVLKLSLDTVLPGAYQLSEYLPMLKGKKIGLVVNHTSIIQNTHLVDSLISLQANVVKLFVPEHGLRGESSAGDLIKDGRDEKTGIPIVSLYGKSKKPTNEQLRDIDLILFDLQDVGVRFFTYISTLHYVIEAASENRKTLIVLDRPNPNGHYVDGPVLKNEFSSFVGLHPIPVVYGMTIGELGKMMIGEGWVKTDSSFAYLIIPCKNYQRSLAFSLPVKPSPNLPDMRSIWLYPGICFFEGTSWSLGRGTDSPFQIFGHPQLTNFDTTFTPREMTGAKNPPHKNLNCKGFSCKNLRLDSLFNSGKIPLKFLLKAHSLQPDSFFSPGKFFDLLAGTDQLRFQIIHQWSEEDIRKSWEKDLKNFGKLRKQYLIYKD